MKYILLFFTPLLIWFQYTDGFPDPDSFYHLKLAELIHEQGIVTSFPWLPLTTLGTHYADHQLLYHIVVSLFLFVAPPVLAAKMVTVLASVGALLLFYWFLKKQHCHFPLFFTFLLGLNPDFIFRASLVKTVSFSFVFLILCYHFISQRQYLRLGVLSFLYVWLYAGFVMAGIVLGAYLVAYGICEWMKTDRIVWHDVYRLGLSVCLGLMAGIVLNPYFPANLSFYYEQIFRIALVNQIHEQVNVGMEWFPYDPQALFVQNAFVFLFFLIGLLLFTLHIRKQKADTITWCLLSYFFLFFTLKSQRNVEYFVPSALIFSALVMSRHVTGVFVQSCVKQCKELLGTVGFFGYIQKAIYLCLVVALLANLGKGLSVTTGYLHDSISVHRFEEASAYLKEHGARRVFHTSWDEFPMLFYHNDVSTYVAGLDPTFFYDADPRKYRLWMDLVLGTQKTNIYATITQEFSADYVLINKDHDVLQDSVAVDSRFVLVYEDEEVWIYLVT